MIRQRPTADDYRAFGCECGSATPCLPPPRDADVATRNAFIDAHPRRFSLPRLTVEAARRKGART